VSYIQYLCLLCVYLALLQANICGMASNYAKHMAQLSARIFGEVVRPTDRKSMKVVRLFAELPYHKDTDLVEYYPRHVELTSLMKRLRFLGLYRSVVELFATSLFGF